jgi:ribonuclease VapC
VNSNKVVLDASAILAVIHGEPGSDKLYPELLANALVSSVNLAEVQSKLVAKGWDLEQAWEDCSSVVDQVLPFTMAHAKSAGSLILATRSLGLSLGDRACLALALEVKAPVYTADRSWKNLKLDLRINLIR